MKKETKRQYIELYEMVPLATLLKLSDGVKSSVSETRSRLRTPEFCPFINNK